MGDVKPVLVVTGTKREAKAVWGEVGVEVVVGGSDPVALAEKLRVRAPSAAGIISFGMCGALDPSLKLGDWYVGYDLWSSNEYSRDGGSYSCHSGWLTALIKAFPSRKSGACYADGEMRTNPETKRLLAEQTPGRIVDMESHIAASAASKADIPFAILRCVSDEVGDLLPPAIGRAMKPDGAIAFGAIFDSIFLQPQQLPALLRIGWRFAKADRSLSAGAKRLAGTRFCFPGG